MNHVKPSLNNSIDGTNTRQPETGLIKDFGTTNSEITDMKANGSGDATIGLLEHKSQQLTEMSIESK